jgi:hypothetical protein
VKFIREKILPSIFVSLILGSLGLALAAVGVPTNVSLTVAALILVVSLVVLIAIYRPLRRYIAVQFVAAEVGENGSSPLVKSFREKIARLAGSPLQGDVLQTTGILGWYGSFRECEPRLVSCLTRARSVRLLTNTGKSDIGKGTRFYDVLASNSTVELRVLMSSRSSPFISEQWALQNGYSADQAKTWQRRARETEEDLRHLQSHHHISIKVRSHNLPFIWRVWIVDGTAFVTAWMKRTRNSDAMFVLELHKSTSDHPTLFEMFVTYFDRIWTEQSDEIL